MIEKIISLIVFAILIMSCNKKQDIAFCVDENGITREVFGYKIDTVYHGAMTFYDSLGNKKKVVNYLNGIGNGYDTVFYENGNIHLIAEVSNGLTEGELFVFHKNKTLKQKSFKIKGKFIGEMYIYFENGSVANYELYMYGGDLVYYRIYSENEKLLGEEGEGIFISFNDRVVFSDEKKSINILVSGCNPPNCQTKLRVYLNEKLYDEKTLPKSFNPSGEIYELNFNAKNPGIYSLLFELHVYDCINSEENHIYTERDTFTVI